MLSLCINLSTLIFSIYVILKNNWSLNIFLILIFLSILSIIPSCIRLSASSEAKQRQKI